MNTEVNGTDLTNAVAPAAPERSPNRQYCDTCAFAQIHMQDNSLRMLCRVNGPQVLGNFLAVQGQQGTVAQLFSETVWPLVTKLDWCPKHVPDPRGARNVQKSANDSVIATA